MEKIIDERILMKTHNFVYKDELNVLSNNQSYVTGLFQDLMAEFESTKQDFRAVGESISQNKQKLMDL